MSEGSWHDLALQISDDRPWVGHMAVEIADRIHRELPQIGEDSALREATRESVADNIGLFVSMVAADVPPDRARPRILAEE